MITLIGLGPADVGGLSVAARDALRAAPLLYVRTARHPAVAELDNSGIPYESLDRFYETGADFDAVYESIAAHLLDRRGGAMSPSPCLGTRLSRKNRSVVC